jgi:hypothetical protein
LWRKVLEVLQWPAFSTRAATYKRGCMLDSSQPHFESKRLPVFLSYSSDDKLPVRKLFGLLKQETELEPWMDERSLSPGEEWEEAIRRQISAAGAVVVCLSRRAVDKEGFFQKEINIALQAAESKPDGFLIPVRLEECEVPRRLSPFHCESLFEQWGYAKLLTALDVRRKQVFKSLEPARQKRDFAGILGVRGWTITWIAAAAFALGRIASTLVGSACYVLTSGTPFSPDITAACVFAFLTLLFFRLIPNAIGASVATAATHGVVMLLIRLNAGPRGMTPAGMPLYALTGVGAAMWALLFLLSVSWAVRAIKPWWVGLWASTSAAGVLGLAISRGLADRAGMHLSSPWWPGIVATIVSAMAFTLVVWAGQHFLPIGRTRRARAAAAQES